MTNVMKTKPLAAIHERAMTFVAQCAVAGQKSVDIYVSTLIVLSYGSVLIFQGIAPLLCDRLRDSLYVQSRRAQIPQHEE